MTFVFTCLYSRERHTIHPVMQAKNREELLTCSPPSAPYPDKLRSIYVPKLTHPSLSHHLLGRHTSPSCHHLDLASLFQVVHLCQLSPPTHPLYWGSFHSENSMGPLPLVLRRGLGTIWLETGTLEPACLGWVPVSPSVLQFSRLLWGLGESITDSGPRSALAHRKAISAFAVVVILLLLLSVK